MKISPSNTQLKALARSKIGALHIPHSSRPILANERARLAISDTELNAELLRMTDSFTDDLFPPTDHGVVFPISGSSVT